MARRGSYSRILWVSLWFVFGCDQQIISLSDSDLALLGEGDDSQAGNAVGFLDDIDEDGSDEVLVASDSYPEGWANGRLYIGDVVSSGPATDVPLADLEIILEGSETIHLGRSLLSGRLLVGSGYELIVSAPSHDASDEERMTGIVHVFLDGTLATIGSGIHAIEGVSDVRITGESPDMIGHSLGVSSDLDGDGTPDIVVGAPFYSESGDTIDEHGKILVFPGQASPGEFTHVDAIAAVMGAEASHTTGFSVETTLDVDNDGRDDLLIGSVGASDGMGMVQLFFGSDLAGNTDTTHANSTLWGENQGDEFGHAMAILSDAEHGNDRVVISAPGSDEIDTDAGVVYVFEGGDIQSSISSQDASVRISGGAMEDQFGSTVANAGDIDHDGMDDLLVAATGYNNQTGAVYLFLGSELTKNKVIAAADAHRIYTGENERDLAGCSIAGGGDGNGDSTDDILIGACKNDDAGEDAGKIYLLFSDF